jgi:hypothetical protein
VASKKETRIRTRCLNNIWADLEKLHEQLISNKVERIPSWDLRAIQQLTSGLKAAVNHYVGLPDRFDTLARHVAIQREHIKLLERKKAVTRRR